MLFLKKGKRILKGVVCEQIEWGRVVALGQAIGVVIVNRFCYYVIIVFADEEAENTWAGCKAIGGVQKKV